MAAAAWGYAVATVGWDGVPLSFYFPDPALGTPGAVGGAERGLPAEHDPVRAVRIRHQLCVTADLDAGPILEQMRVPVEPGETHDTLATKVHAAEHALLPRVIARLSEGAPVR